VKNLLHSGFLTQGHLFSTYAKKPSFSQFARLVWKIETKITLSIAFGSNLKI